MTFSLSVSVQKTTISDKYSKETLSRRNIAITRFMDTVTLSTVDSVQNRFYIVFGVRLLIFLIYIFLYLIIRTKLYSMNSQPLYKFEFGPARRFRPENFNFFAFGKIFPHIFFGHFLPPKRSEKKNENGKIPNRYRIAIDKRAPQSVCESFFCTPAPTFSRLFSHENFSPDHYTILYFRRKGVTWLLAKKKNPPNYCALSPRRKPIRNEHKSLFGGRSLLAHPLLYVIFYYVL